VQVSPLYYKWLSQCIITLDNSNSIGCSLAHSLLLKLAADSGSPVSHQAFADLHALYLSPESWFDFFRWHSMRPSSAFNSVSFSLPDAPATNGWNKPWINWRRAVSRWIADTGVGLLRPHFPSPLCLLQLHVPDVEQTFWVASRQPVLDSLRSCSLVDVASVISSTAAMEVPDLCKGRGCTVSGYCVTVLLWHIHHCMCTGCTLAVCMRALQGLAAARESLRRSRPVVLTSPALRACGSARPFRPLAARYLYATDAI
jgi:hypothetical protein